MSKRPADEQIGQARSPPEPAIGPFEHFVAPLLSFHGSGRMVYWEWTPGTLGAGTWYTVSVHMVHWEQAPGVLGAGVWCTGSGCLVY